MTVNFPQPLRLAVGSHQAGSGKGCAMNVISWENGDTTITDFPSCSDPFLAIVVQRINDSICTHRQGDLLCSDCSIKVLEIGHRTVGTNLNHIHSAAERAAERAEIYAKIARTEVFYIAAAPGAAAADAAAAAYAAQAERIFNQFEAFSGIKSKPVDKQVVIEAVQKMRTVSV